MKKIFLTITSIVEKCLYKFGLFAAVCLSMLYLTRVIIPGLICKWLIYDIEVCHGVFGFKMKSVAFIAHLQGHSKVYDEK